MGVATYHGMGLHIWQFTPELNSEYYLWIGISSEFYVTSLAGFKCALLLLYLQLFGINQKFRIACYLTMFYTLGYLTCNALTEFFGCHPIAKKWNDDLPGWCINRVVVNIIYGAGHMTSDLIIGILPLVMVWRLQFRTTRQKIGLSLVLSCGLIAWAVACVRWAFSTYDSLSYDRPWGERRRERRKIRSSTILFCGSDEFSCASLEALHQEHYATRSSFSLLMFVVRPGKRTGRGNKIIQHPPIRDLATRLGLPIHERDTLQDGM
ncbi:putative integral membrane protein [Daldinia childiae]|uniref:putative integral membrane protein n=1 Tax=Daldinia childiae TaxID=326645 RepID=UPI0014468E98|nr:putative integral membrane protein [Daldinia childiae]KAF3058153.1 putative integral membrane protein [Daldinia childiae]